MHTHVHVRSLLTINALPYPPGLPSFDFVEEQLKGQSKVDLLTLAYVASLCYVVGAFVLHKARVSSRTA
eukprot:5593509-Pyramimonas_sp.AAC.2